MDTEKTEARKRCPAHGVSLQTNISAGRPGEAQMVEVEGDTLHTEHGCYHASLFGMWRRLHAAAELFDHLGLENLGVVIRGGDRDD